MGDEGNWSGGGYNVTSSSVGSFLGFGTPEALYGVFTVMGQLDLRLLDKAS